MIKSYYSHNVYKETKVPYIEKDEVYLKNGLSHRENGPALKLVNLDGSFDYFWNTFGKLHRKDGPAVEFSDGVVEYWIDGELMCKIYNKILL